MNLALIAFFSTLASAQVLTRSQLNPEKLQTQKEMMSELKAKAKAQGLTETPAEWVQEAEQARQQGVEESRVAIEKESEKEKAVEQQRDERSLEEIAEKKLAAGAGKGTTPQNTSNDNNVLKSGDEMMRAPELKSSNTVSNYSTKNEQLNTTTRTYTIEEINQMRAQHAKPGLSKTIEQ